jgi:hypothetical protein
LGIASASKVCQSVSTWGPLGDREAELGEDLDQLEADLGQQVEVTGRDRPGRQRQIDPARQLGAAAARGQRGQAGLDGRGDRVLDPVGGLADPGPIGRGQAAELLHDRRDLALFAEEVGLGRAHRLLVFERGDRVGELAGEALELGDQIVGSQNGVSRGRSRHGSPRRSAAENASRPPGATSCGTDPAARQSGLNEATRCRPTWRRRRSRRRHPDR